MSHVTFDFLRTAHWLFCRRWSHQRTIRACGLCRRNCSAVQHVEHPLDEARHGADLHRRAEPSGMSTRAAPTGTPFLQHTDNLRAQLRFVQKRAPSSARHATRTHVQRMRFTHLRPSLNWQRQGPTGSRRICVCEASGCDRLTCCCSARPTDRRPVKTPS